MSITRMLGARRSNLLGMSAAGVGVLAGAIVASVAAQRYAHAQASPGAVGIRSEVPVEEQ
jgi:hypothetical protein